MSQATEDKLSTRTKLYYGVGDIGNAMVNSAIQFFLLVFYTDGALIAPALAGGALMVGKIWDAVNDPLFGWISDRTTSRFGKRRVYMIFGALPLAVSIVLLWIVPLGLSATAIFVWIAVTFIFYDTMNTLTSVPYYALTAELTEDYDERASLTTFRMVLGVPAYLVGAAVTPIIVGLFATKRAGFGATGMIYAIIAAAVLWICAAGIRERKEISEAKSETPPVRAFVDNLPQPPLCPVDRRLPHSRSLIRPDPDPHGLLFDLPTGDGGPGAHRHGLAVGQRGAVSLPLEKALGPLEQGPRLRFGAGHRRTGRGLHLFPAT